MFDDKEWGIIDIYMNMQLHWFDKQWFFLSVSLLKDSGQKVAGDSPKAKWMKMRPHMIVP